MAHRSALSNAVRKSVAGTPRVGGAGLQCRGSLAESDQSILDAAAPGHRRAEGARCDRIYLPAVRRAFAAGAVPAVVVGVVAHLPSANDALGSRSGLFSPARVYQWRCVFSKLTVAWGAVRRYPSS